MTMFSKRGLLLLRTSGMPIILLLSFSVTGIGYENPAELSDLEISVVDAQLKALPYRVSSFVNRRKPGADLASGFDAGMRSRGVPFGTYDYFLVRKDVLKPIASSIRGSLIVGEKRVLLTLAPPNWNLKVIDGRETLGERQQLRWWISGRFDQLPTASGRLWARLIQLPSGFTQDVAVTPSGEFTAGAVEGYYVLTLLGEGRALHSVPLQFGPRRTDTPVWIRCCNAVDLTK